MSNGYVIKRCKLGNNKELVLRALKFSDWKQVLDVWNSVVLENDYLAMDKPSDEKTQKSYIRKALKEIKEGKTTNIVAEVSGTIVGSVSGHRAKGRLNHLSDFGIAIRKEYRGMGIGKELMCAFEEIVKGQGVKIIKMDCMSTNETALNLYKKSGFKKYGILPKGIKRKGKYIDLVSLYKEI